MAEPKKSGLSEQPVVLELSQSQVDQIVRAADGSGSPSLLFTGLAEASTKIATASRKNPQLSASLLTGLAVLALFPPDGTALSNVQVARTLKLNASTTHRYISTLRAAGLLYQDPDTRKYRALS